MVAWSFGVYGVHRVALGFRALSGHEMRDVARTLARVTEIQGNLVFRGACDVPWGVWCFVGHVVFRGGFGVSWGMWCLGYL